MIKSPPTSTGNIRRILTCFDKFKDTLKGRQCGEAVIESIRGYTKAETISNVNIPLSDGGEGYGISQNY